MSGRFVLELAAGVAIVGGVMGGAYALITSSFDGMTASVGPVLIAIAVAVALWFGRGLVGTAGAVGHAHGGDLETVKVHEAGHIVAAGAVGGRVTSVKVDSGGWLSGPSGWVKWDMSHRDPAAVRAANVTFLLAGQYAAGTMRGCAGDQASIREVLADLPSREAARVRAESDRAARRIVASNRAKIQRVAGSL